MKWLILLLVLVGAVVIALSAEADPGRTLLVGDDPSCKDGCELRISGFVAARNLVPGDCVVGLSNEDARLAVLCNDGGCSAAADHVTPHPALTCERFVPVGP